MLIDILALLHLVLYPMLTGVLMTTTTISLVRGNRWIMLSGPAFVFMTVLTVHTHLNYMEYML
jgi:hypothetical protein